MLTGREWMIDAEGCAAEALRDGAGLRQLCAAIIHDLSLHVVGEPQWHQFPWPAGWTGMYLLSESHLTCHTFPEHRLATFNLYCCRPRNAWDWESNLRTALQAESVRVCTLERGISSPDARVCSPASAAEAAP